MSLLTICRDAADELQVTRPSSIITNTDDDARRLLRYSTRVGRDLMRRHHWSTLRKERTFAAVAGETQANILPDDFDRIVPECFWDRSNKSLITGPTSATQWQGLKTYGYTDTQSPKYALRGNAIHVLPALAGGEVLAFEYVSNEWCENSSGTGSNAWTADDDTAKLDEELMTLGVISEWLASEVLPSAAKAGDDYEKAVKKLIRNDQPTAGVLAAGDLWGRGRHFDGQPAVSGSSIYNT